MSLSLRIIPQPLSKHQKTAILSTVITGAADIAVQKLTKTPYDIKRTLRMVTFSYVSFFPQQSYFDCIDSIFYQHTLSSAIQKTITNQIIFAPINICCAIAWDLFFQSKQNMIGKKIKSSLFPSLIEGSTFWIPVNLIAFSMIPSLHRVMFFKACGVPYKLLLNNRVTSKI